jgi:hypothetical protein
MTGAQSQAPADPNAKVPPAPSKPQQPKPPQQAREPKTQTAKPKEQAAPAPAAPPPTVNPEVKDQLLQLIYDMMVQKGFNSPRGHLLMDVYIEVWREVVGPAAAAGGKTALERFASFLGTAPHMFEVFDLNILPTGQKERTDENDNRERMVRLLKQK